MKKTHGGARAKSGPKTKASKGQRKYERMFISMPPELYDVLNQKRGLVQMSTYICDLIRKGLEQ